MEVNIFNNTKILFLNNLQMAQYSHIIINYLIKIFFHNHIHIKQLQNLQQMF